MDSERYEDALYFSCVGIFERTQRAMEELVAVEKELGGSPDSLYRVAEELSDLSLLARETCSLASIGFEGREPTWLH